MKKSIFLFFAAILCAMSANAATYLAGSMNGWSSSNSSYEFKGSPLTLNVELPGKTYYEFKIVADGSWKGNSGTINNSISNWAFNGGDNCKLNTNLPGVYKFVWNSGKLSVTYPEAPAPHDITVRAKVPASWTNVKAWVWTSENGEGTEITPEKEGDYYVVTKNAGALFVIYKNGTGWSNGDKNQTVDLVYTEDVCLQLNQSGEAKATAAVIDCGAVAKDITVKAVVPEAWGDNVWAHVWETGASGTDVKLTEKEGNWYVYTKNCLELNIIFKSGEGWDNIEQTADIKGIKENACYSISSINKTDGKCNVTEVDCEAAIEPEVKPEDIYTVVGSSAELGLEWDPAKEANDMEKQDDGSYKKVYSNVELTSDVEWKIAKNDNWWNETPLENKADNGNSVLVIAKSGIYNVTFTLSADLKTAHAEAELLEETNTVADCFVSGNAALTGGAGWAGNEFKMEYDPATETYSYTLTGLAAETAYELQVVLGGNWYGYEKLQTIPTGVENKEGHIAFTLTEAGDVTVTYHVTNGINLTGNFALPVTYDYYLTGTLVGGWSAKQQGLEKDGELYKATFTELNAGTYQFKITDGQFNTEEDKTHEHTTLAAEYKEVSYVEGNIQFVTEEAINLTVIFDAATDKITFEGLTPVVVTYQLKGVGGWEQPGIELVQNPDPEKASEYMLTCQAISATDAIKVVRLENGEIKDYYGNGTVKDGVEVTVEYDDQANIKLPAGTYNFYFDTAESEKKLWIAAATDCVTEPTEETIELYDFAWEISDGSLVMSADWNETPVYVEIYEAGETLESGTYNAFLNLGGWADASIDAAEASVELLVWANGLGAEMTGTFVGETTGTKYNLSLMGTMPSGSGEATEYNIEESNVQGVINPDGNLVLQGETATIMLYAFDPTITEPTAYEAEVMYNDYSAYAYGIVTAVTDGTNVEVYGEGLEGEDMTGSAIINASFVGTILQDGAAVDVAVSDLVVMSDEDLQIAMLSGTGQHLTLGNLTFELYLSNYTGDNNIEYQLTSESMVYYLYRGMSRPAAITGSITKSYSSELNTDVYTGTVTTTIDEQVYEINLTMYYIEPEAVDMTVTNATITLEEGTLFIEGEWNSYPFIIWLDEWSEDKQYQYINIEVGVWGENYYGMLMQDPTKELAITVENNTLTFKGYFIKGDNQQLHNVTISGTFPTEEEPTPDYTRTVTYGNYGTICLPFGATSYTGMELYEFVGCETGKAYIASVTTLEAGVPYIFRATATELAVYSDGTTAPAGSHNGLHGTFDNEIVVAEGDYILLNNVLRPSDGTAKVNANRAYIVWGDIPAGAPQQMPGRKYISMDVQGENETTGVEDLFTTEAPAKVIENGQLIIIRDGVKYNVQGQKL